MPWHVLAREPQSSQLGWSSSRDVTVVGVPGFEPGTSWSQTKRADQTALHPGDR